MKVTIVSREYPPYVYGGAGVHVRELSRCLADICDVEVRCFGDQEGTAGRVAVRGYLPGKKIKTSRPEIGPVFDTILTNLMMLADGIDSDIVHTHTWYSHFAGFLAKRMYNTGFIATCHSLEPLRPWKAEQLAEGYEVSKWMEQVGIENADRIIAVSGEMKRDITEVFNIPPERISVVHNGIDISRWRPRPISRDLRERYGIAEDYILFVGRPTAQKGMEYLARAADDIPVQVVFGAVGADTKDYEERMREMVETKRNIVWIHEMLKEDEYIELYTSASVFVCPSVYEPFGITNLEAMACETPVVASGVGGILEVVVDGETGFLVPPRDPRAIVERVKRILVDPDLGTRMGRAGRRRVEERFTWEAIAARTKEIYEEVAG